MNPTLQRRVQRYGWDKASPNYEDDWSAQLSPAQTRLLELAALRPGEQVLDVACGTGLVTLPAAAAVGEHGRVVGTDISEGMVRRACAAAAAVGLGWVECERMDAEDLRFPAGTFDVALCALGLMYFPDPIGALRQMRRVLKPDGRIAALVWGERDRCGWSEIFPIVDARVHTEVCPLFFQLGTGDVLASALEGAGFVDVQLERVTTELEYESADAALHAAFAGGPVALAYSRFDEQTRAEAHASYLASIERYGRGVGYAIPGEFLIVRGRRTAASVLPKAS